MNKLIHAKPSLYAFYFETLKEIALRYGYNLVLHGSMNRDLDLIAIPWQEEIKPYPEMIKEFADCIGGSILEDATRQKSHRRECWVIDINRGGTKLVDGEYTYSDPEYYIDISVILT